MCDVEAQRNSAGTKTVVLILRIIFHAVYVVGDLFADVYTSVDLLALDLTKVDPLIRDLRTLTPLFFTNWNFTFQVVFLALSLVYDVIQLLNHHNSDRGKQIKYWRDIIFCGMVVPFTLFVTCMFWAVFAIDRELVFPKVYDEVIPWWFNQCVHTNITVMVILETLLQPRRKPTNATIEQFLFWTIGLAYTVVYYLVYFFTNRWLYRVFGVMTWWQICIFQLFIWGSAFAVYKLQFPVNRLIHGPEDDESNVSEKLYCDGKENQNNDDEHFTKETNENNIDKTDREEIDENEDSENKNNWSLKFRNIKNQFEGTRL